METVHTSAVTPVLLSPALVPTPPGAAPSLADEAASHSSRTTSTALRGSALTNCFWPWRVTDIGARRTVHRAKHACFSPDAGDDDINSNGKCTPSTARGETAEGGRAKGPRFSWHDLGGGGGTRGIGQKTQKPEGGRASWVSVSHTAQAGSCLVSAGRVSAATTTPQLTPLPQPQH